MAPKNTNEFADFEVANEFADFEAPSQPGILQRIAQDIGGGEIVKGIEEGARRLGQDIVSTVARMEPTVGGTLETQQSLGFETPEQTAQREAFAKQATQAYQTQFPQLPLKTTTGEIVAGLVGTAPLGAGGNLVTSAVAKGIANIPKVGAVIAPAVSNIAVAPIMGILQEAQTASQLGKEYTPEQAKESLAFGSGLGAAVTALGGIAALRGTLKAKDQLVQKSIDDLKAIESQVPTEQLGTLPIQVNGQGISELVGKKIEKLTRLKNTQAKKEERLLLKAANVEERYGKRIKAVQEERAAAQAINPEDYAAVDAKVSELDAKTLNLRGQMDELANAEFQYTPPSYDLPGDISQIDQDISVLKYRLNELKSQGIKRGTVTLEKDIAAKQQQRENVLKRLNEISTIEEPAAQDAARLQFIQARDKKMASLQRDLQEVQDLRTEYQTVQRMNIIDAKREKLFSINKRLTEKENSLNLQLTTDLNKVSDDYAAVTERLLKERKQWASRLGLGPVDETADRFAEIDAALQRLQQVKDEMTFKYQTVPEKITAKTWSPTLATDLAAEQAKKVSTFAKLKLIPEAQVPALTDLVFNEVLKMQNAIPKSQWVVPPKIMNFWMNGTNSLNTIQRKLGVRTGETALKATQALPAMQNYTVRKLTEVKPAIDTLKKMGYSPNEITRVLQYFETLPDKSIQFTTSELRVPGTQIPAWDTRIAPPTAEAQQSFIQLRQWLNNLADENKIEFRQRYVPIMQEVIGDSGTAKVGVKSISAPAFEQVRKIGELVPGVTETDFERIALRYTKNIARSKFAKPIIKDAFDQVAILKMMGYNSQAKIVEDYVVDSFNLADANDLQRAFIANTFEDSLPYIKQALKQADINEAQQYNAISQFADALQESAAVNLAGINPRVWMLQAMQPEATLSSLVGFRRVEQARFSRIPKEEMPRINRLVDASIADDLQVLDGFAGPDKTANIPKLIERLNKPAKKVAQFTMGKMEKANRTFGIKAADTLFEDAWKAGETAGLEKIAFKHLNESQRNMVRSAFQTGGKEAAKDAFAVIITNQANMIYNIADKPKALRGPLLNRLMFTTFSRGVANQLVTSIEEGRIGSLAAQIVKPLALAGVIAGGSMLADKKAVSVPGLNPIDSISGLITTDIRPAPLLPFTTTGALPIVGVYKQIEKLPKRKFVEEARDLPDFLLKQFQETERLIKGTKRR